MILSYRIDYWILRCHNAQGRVVQPYRNHKWKCLFMKWYEGSRLGRLVDTLEER